MKVLTKALIKESEENAVKSGAFSYRELMHIAGTVAAETILKNFDCINKRVAVVCGNGNNGGDGFVIARNLYEHGCDVTVIMPCGEPVTEDAKFYRSKLGSVKIENNLNGEYDFVIDAVFGIGLNRAPSVELCELFDKINAQKAVKIAIDIPSGVEADTGKVFSTTVRADFTVTFIALKPCFMLPSGSDYCGKVQVADIGVKVSNYSYSVIEKPEFSKRPHNCHKGNFGTALLFCGSYGMAGAAILATRAALRSGVGIARCVVCDGIYSAFTSVVPEAVCVPVKQSKNGTFGDIDVEGLYSKADAILFGCGVGNTVETQLLVEKIIKTARIPVVLDADGINALSGSISLLKESKAPIIITPHPGEMARLCNKTIDEVESNRINTACEFAEEYGCIVVLKGADTIVAVPDGDIYFNITGNAGMATGGSGDVLAGIIVSLLAQGYSPEFSAKSAVYLHGEAGDKATAKRGERAMIPSDIIEEL